MLSGPHVVPGIEPGSVAFKEIILPLVYYISLSHKEIFIKETTVYLNNWMSSLAVGGMS